MIFTPAFTTKHYIYITLDLDSKRRCTSGSDFHSKKLSSLKRITGITSFGKSLGISSGHTGNFCPNLVQYRLKNMFQKESLTRSSTVI